MTNHATHCRNDKPPVAGKAKVKKPVVRYVDEMESRKSVARMIVYFILGILVGFFLIVSSSQTHVKRHDLYDTPKRRAIEQIPPIDGSSPFETSHTAYG